MGFHPVTDQLELVLAPATPKLTARQQTVLDALTAAGADGLEPSEAGAHLHALKEGRWAHSREQRCEWCPRDGLAVLRRLRALGLARYRAKTKVWTTMDAPAAEVEWPRGMLRPDEALPF